ncbi:MAG TPA: hypothetical protein VMU94_14535 [Streptosporangiaceae bacterium]|nr:hypothetical protein [Streptosporangiaceae bacterium]
MAASALAVAATACGPAHSLPPGVSLAAVTRPPEVATSVLAGTPDTVAANAAWRLFASSPLIVVANADREADLARAAGRAERTHAPLLLLSPKRQRAATTVSAGVALRTETRALAARAVLDVGVGRALLSAELPSLQVITGTARLPARGAPAALSNVVMLVHRGDTNAGATAAEATARAAGVQIITVAGFDPRTDPSAISALSAARPQHVIAVGAGFRPARLLAARVAVAATGVQLPGGGDVLFPMHRLLALYGYPGAPVLGALGEQSLSASIARIHRIAASYRSLSGVPVVPAFEIIATVAQASPGPDGTYSYESTVASLRPWVRRATQAGMYVVLDLQPGRASLLAQARRYRSLLKLPSVGLALDPEWKLQPGQLPLRQIGSVAISEVNGVVRWLAGLTARYHLPQKLLVLHQFRLSMISDEQRLDTRHDDLAIVIHMDGQGTPEDKLQTWQTVVKNAPAGVFFGWKNFFAKDHPTLSPLQTMSNAPKPIMISYQ